MPSGGGCAHKNLNGPPVPSDFEQKGTGVGFRFSDPYFHDGLRFAGPPSAVDCADDYNWLGDCTDLKICVMAG